MDDFTRNICVVLVSVKQMMPSQAADRYDLLASILNVREKVYVALTHHVETGLQAPCDQLVIWPQVADAIVGFPYGESSASGNVLPS